MSTSEASDEVQLKRVLYLCNTYPHFISGDPLKHNLSDLCFKELVGRLLEKSSDNFLSIVSSVAEDPNLPRRFILQYILVVALIKSETPELKGKVLSSLLNICRNDEEFFNFISLYKKFTLKKNKVTTAISKTICKFYESKNALQMATNVARNHGYHGWKHKDLIKLGHYKSASILKHLISTYVLFGLEKINNPEDNDTKSVVDILKKHEQLRTTSDESVAASLVTELHATMEQVNTKLHKSPEVWAAVIPELSPRDVLKRLPKLYKMGLLKANTPVHSKVVEVLSDTEKVKACNLHPVEVFIHLKNFEKGGKPMDPKLVAYLTTKEAASGDAAEKKPINVANTEPKCNVVISTINKALGLAYANRKGSGTRIMIVIDATDRMDNLCLHNKNITCLEAAVAITLYILKVEKDVKVAVLKDKEVQLINLEKHAPYQQTVQKIKEMKGGSYVNPLAPIEWALSKKKNIDTFITFVHDNFLITLPKEQRKCDISGQLQLYRERMNLPKTKLATVCLSSTRLCLSDKKESMVMFSGFDTETTKALEAFYRNSFS